MIFISEDHIFLKQGKLCNSVIVGFQAHVTQIHLLKNVKESKVLKAFMHDENYSIFPYWYSNVNTGQKIRIEESSKYIHLLFEMTLFTNIAIVFACLTISIDFIATYKFGWYAKNHIWIKELEQLIVKIHKVFNILIFVNWSNTYWDA